MSGIDDLAHDLRPSSGTPDGALVLLHGRGMTESDMAPLIEQLDPDRRLVALAPRGPLSLPPGGAHWYSARRVGFPEPDTFAPTYARLAAWFDALPEATGIPPERTVLGGFSQGAAMSYALGLGAGRPRPAGLIALSGFIPTVDGFALDLGALDGYPVAIGHGTFDPVLELELARDARRRLAAAGAAVTWRESPVPHTLAPDFLPELARFVRAALGRSG